ncbi:hypothetical protein IW138_004850 [Coemansia sp. RSA 986]|nr:hypothetical protein IW138_004850 [Coemansia sp. RSA 986]
MVTVQVKLMRLLPVQNISATIEMLKRLDSALGKVKYLNMFIFPAVEDMEGTDEQMVSDVAELEILAKKLVELVPNVRYIRCTGPAMGIVSTAFQHNRLVNDVFSKFTELGDDNMEYYDVINNLFGKHKIAKSIECVVKRQLSPDFSHMHLATADGQHADEKTCDYVDDE